MTTSARTLAGLHWPIVIGLGALALVRPLVSLVLDQAGGTRPAIVPILLTVAISVVWIVVVGLGRISRPVLTLIGAGLAYALLSIVLSSIASPLLTGELQGPLANPIAIVPLLVVNAVWGGVCGLLAAGVQRLRRDRRPVGPAG